ncbi:hypothetical protein GCM10009589_04530 [Arthrobacter pascens]
MDGGVGSDFPFDLKVKLIQHGGQPWPVGTLDDKSQLSQEGLGIRSRYGLL